MAKIIVCDDSAFMRMMLKTLLIENGHEVVGEAGDGAEAVELYRQLKPDIATMDITMPKIDGIEAVRLILAENSQAKVVMVTAIGQKAVMKDALSAGAVDFLVKPFDSEQVLATIQKIADEIENT